MDKEKFEELKLSVQQMKDMEKIPEGLYCYDKNGRCPFWRTIEGREEQENGWCDFLGKGDYEINREEKEYEVTQYIDGEPHTYIEKCGPENPSYFSLLWDECKECGIKDEWKEE